MRFKHHAALSSVYLNGGVISTRMNTELTYRFTSIIMVAIANKHSTDNTNFKNSRKGTQFMVVKFKVWLPYQLSTIFMINSMMRTYPHWMWFKLMIKITAKLYFFDINRRTCFKFASTTFAIVFNWRNKCIPGVCSHKYTEFHLFKYQVY
jgi:hypothetical protein